MPFYPTRRAILLTLAGAPVALLTALAAPQLWSVAAAWILMAAGLMIADLLLAASPSRLTLAVSAPSVMDLGGARPAQINAAFTGAGPRELELAVDVNALLVAAPSRQSAPVMGGEARLSTTLTALRRGEGRVETAWARWRGPFGLVWVQRVLRPDTPIVITPAYDEVKSQARRLFSRDALFGMKAQLERGDGGDFHALTDFQTGMDLNAIDWKQSGRHGKLVAREFRTERNHHIVLAIDSGRLMSAPTAGASRLDQAVKAALLLAFVGLRLGDRVGLFAFAAKPSVASGLVAGAHAYPQLQKLAAGIDYSAEETNFTLGLATLSARLKRRALVIVFTDFADPTSAELMIESVGRLTRTHLVLFVVFHDFELETLARAEPQAPEDVTRAVIAGDLARRRESVVARLRRRGVRIVEAQGHDLGLAVIDSYLDVTRRGLV